MLVTKKYYFFDDYTEIYAVPSKNDGSHRFSQYTMSPNTSIYVVVRVSKDGSKNPCPATPRNATRDYNQPV